MPSERSAAPEPDRALQAWPTPRLYRPRQGQYPQRQPIRCMRPLSTRACAYFFWATLASNSSAGGAARYCSGAMAPAALSACPALVRRPCHVVDTTLQLVIHTAVAIFTQVWPALEERSHRFHGRARCASQSSRSQFFCCFLSKHSRRPHSPQTRQPSKVMCSVPATRVAWLTCASTFVRREPTRRRMPTAPTLFLALHREPIAWCSPVTILNPRHSR